MSPVSPTYNIKQETFGESSIMGAMSAGLISAGLPWGNEGLQLRMEDAVVETVVTKTIRTTTSFAPINLPRVPQPEALAIPHHLSTETYPLAHESAPADLTSFSLNLGGRRVTIADERRLTPEPEGSVPQGWSRMVHRDMRDDNERLGLVQALNRAKGKEPRKRPHEFTRPGTRADYKADVTTPPPMDGPSMRQRSSPPRKRTRGLEELTLNHDGSNALLSPLPSPEHEAGPSMPQSAGTDSPTVGSGMEVAALFSLPSIVSHFEQLPDKLQQHVLMHLLRRSRIPTIQRITAFANTALKRDFISMLPHELAVHILAKVDTKSLAKACRVSKKWKKLIDSERGVWAQRLVDDNLWFGLGVEEEEEQMLVRRMETLDSKVKSAERDIKAGTPIEDESMESISIETPVELEWPVALKHVYRRRHSANHHWLHREPKRNSFPGHGTNVVTCLQFDSDKIVSASDDHSINIYSTHGGTLRKRLDGHEGGVWALEYKGDTLVSGSTDRTVRIWDLENLVEAHCFHGHTSTVRCLQIVEPVFDPATGEYQPPVPMIVTGSRDASLRVWKLPKKGESAKRSKYASAEEIIPPSQNPWHVHHLEGHTQAVRALAAHGRICVSGSYDTTVRVWDIVKGTCLHVLSGHEQKVYSIVYDRLRNRCASGSMDNTVKIWDVGTGECLATLTGHTSLVGLLGYSPNYLVSAAADASLRIWDANTHELKHTLGSHGGAITCFHADETKVISGSDGTLKLWDIRTGRYIRDLVVGINSVWQVAVNDNLLVAASNRQGTTVFDVFDFGKDQHPIDDIGLDALRRPSWERDNPREPRTYQIDEIDEEPGYGYGGYAYSSPSPHRGSRRSTRLAQRASASASARYQPAPPPTTQSQTATTTSASRRKQLRSQGHDQHDSPTPIAGPSRIRASLSYVRHSDERVGDGENDEDEDEDVSEDGEIEDDKDGMEFEVVTPEPRSLRRRV